MNKSVGVIVVLLLGAMLASTLFSGGGNSVDVESAPVEKPDARHETVVVTPEPSDASPAERKFADLERDALRGNVDARKKLCKQWLEIGSVTVDYSRAVTWCELAAQSGDVESQLTLARLYERGRGLPAADAQKAMQWYEQAAKQSPEAMYQLARMLLASDVPGDQARGTALLQQAAARGHSNANWELQKRGETERPQRDQSLLAPPRQ